MKDLFNEFDAISESRWIEKIKADLKGKPLEVLASKPEPDLNIVAYHHRDSSTAGLETSYARNLTRSQNNWAMRQIFTNESGANTTILKALNEGADAIGIVLNEEGIALEKLTEGIGFEYINSDITFSTKEKALKSSVHGSTHLNFDIICQAAVTGSFNHSLADFHAFYSQHPNNKTIWISGSLYGRAGASTVQELGMTLAHLNEYIQFLVDNGEDLQTINSKIALELSVNENYFVNLAKFRVIRALIPLLMSGYDQNYKPAPITLYAKTNCRHLAKNDKNNNPLRQTTQAMSAVIGGCDVLTIDYGQYGSAQEIERFKRIAKNIQLILKEEAYLDNVMDPAGGAYYIESLSTQILEKSWQLFLEIEENGGLIESLKKGIIQQKIDTNKAALIQDLNGGKRTFLGVNKYPNGTESWVESKPAPVESSTHVFETLSAFYLENYYSKPTESHV